jgi:hypothetical protein
MTNEKGGHAYKRSPAYTFWSIVWAIVLAAVGLSSRAGGLWLLAYLGPAVFMLVNAWWCWRTPYVRIDRRGVTAYSSIVMPSRAVAWSDVKHLRSKANGRLYLLGQDYAGVSIRMKTVTMNQRAALVDEVLSRSGRRLLPTPAKPSKRPLLSMPRKSR